MLKLEAFIDRENWEPLVTLCKNPCFKFFDYTGFPFHNPLSS